MNYTYKTTYNELKVTYDYFTKLFQNKNPKPIKSIRKYAYTKEDEGAVALFCSDFDLDIGKTIDLCEKYKDENRNFV